ncbi:MULE transposase domain [Sesbania bispinosa]|nr:MULE transposase domain [Sesbania bispinosa]
MSISMDDILKESNVGDEESTYMKEILVGEVVDSERCGRVDGWVEFLPCWVVAVTMKMGFWTINDVSGCGQNDEGNSNEKSQNDSDEGGYDEEYESTNEEGGLAGNGDEGIAIDGIHDFANINWKTLTMEEFMKYHFADLEVAFKCYNWYARRKGFSARKDKVGKNKAKVVIRQIFVCSREGFPKVKEGSYKRERRRIIRCGCKAHCKMRLNADNNRWHVTSFVENHNHAMLEQRFHGMLPSHRRMEEHEIEVMNQMRGVGISTPSIYQAFASQTEGIRKIDPAIFVRHKTNDDGRLQHLFWCDGVNHHNQTTIFAFAVVSNETEDTYVWVLEQFFNAMKGKSPKSVITDGDRAMRNAIRIVFPNATHRLCE